MCHVEVVTKEDLTSSGVVDLQVKEGEIIVALIMMYKQSKMFLHYLYSEALCWSAGQVNPVFSCKVVL